MSQYCSSLPASLHQHVGAVASGSRCRAATAAGGGPQASSLFSLAGCSDSGKRSTSRSRAPRRRHIPSSAVVRHYHQCAETTTSSPRTRRNLSTSTQRSAPPSPATHDQHHPTPITYATTAKSPQGPTSWWHRAFSFSSTQRNADRESLRIQTQPPIPHTRAAPASSASHLDSPCDDINTLMNRPDIFENIKVPRNPIVLCHGLYGFDVRGPFFGLEIHYWAVVLDILREKIGADVIVRGVPGTGSIAQRAQVLHDFLRSDEAGVKGKKLNFIGHSMGGLDARYLISHLKPKPDEYTPVSLTTLSTPHKGSPFMDWCNANVGIGRDHVEDAIREYKQQQAVAAESSATTEEQEAESLPYSLKTPLFVRPRKDAKKEAEQAAPDQDKDLSATAVADIKEKVDQKLADAASKDGSKANNASSSNTLKSLASLGFVTPLTRALSSLTGHFSSYMLSVLDTPAYAMLSTRYMSKVFNPSTPDSPHVKYFSIAARTRKIPLWHPLWLPKVILDAAAESRTVGAERDGSAAALGNPETQGNDGLVAVQSAKWGTFLGVIEQKDHWDLRGSGAPRWGAGGKLNPATGKPWANGKGPNGNSSADKKNQADAEQMVPGRSDKDVKDTRREEGWLTINRLLGGLIGDKGGEATKSDKTAAPAESDSALAAVTEAAKDLVTPDKSAASKNEDPSKDTTAAVPEFVDEVAEWISDRLPQGSAERRKLADEAAQQQEADLRDAQTLAAASGPASDFYEPTWAGSDVHNTSSGNDSATSSSSSPPPPVTLGSSPTVDAITPASSEEEVKSRRYMLRLQREAEWLERGDTEDTVSEGKDASTLRREIEWHRREHLKRFGGGSGSGSAISEEVLSTSTSSPPSSPKKKKEKVDKEREELERFWIALCQHLYSHGF